MNANRSKAPGPKKDKDRPKSTEKPKGKNKERGTPENKPTTPGLDDERNGDSHSSVLNDDEIQSLAIKQDTLNQIRASITADMVPQAPKDTKPVNVRKVNKNPPPPRITKSITVAKGAPPRAPLKPVETEGNSGPMFDGNGNVIAHSILGTLEEYKMAAENKGELAVDYYIRDQDRVQTPTILPEKYRKSALVKGETTTQPKCENVEQSNALLHWQNKMCERKLQQGHISRLLGKPEEDLVMNQVDKYRKKQELRYLIDRSIPAVDYGKGYRVGSEFWDQRQLIGDEELGLHMTLSQTQKGYPPPIEHVDVPASIRKEKGLSSRPKSGLLNKPWHRSNFLRERISELKPVMQDLDPHKPASEGLEIIGTNNPYARYIRAATPASEKSATPSIPEVGDENQDPLSNHPDVYTPPMFGPAIKFAGELLQWTGEGYSAAGTTAVDARVTFEAHAGCRSTSILEIVNLGTAAMYFSWKMLPKSNPFDLVNASVQRFYFNTSSGVILPGQTLNFPFVFKSDKAGVFGEQWEFQTHPVIAGGAALVVTLRGVAIREDKLKKQRELIENKLQKNIIWKKMRRLVEEIVDSIKSPERPKSPIDSYLTEEEVFQRQNPQLYYKHHIVQKLKDLYKMLVAPPTMDGDENGETKNDDEAAAVTWNLNVAEFKKAVLELSDEDERKTSMLETINESVMQLSFHHVSPRFRKMYKACYQTFCNTVDNMIGHAMQLRTLLGLPEREQDDKLDESARDLGTSSTASRRLSNHSSAALSAGKKRLSVDYTAAAGGKVAAPKVTPKTGSKEEKKSGKAEPKKEAKGKETAKKSDRASPVKKTPPSRAAASLATTSAEGRITPSTTVEPASQANTGVDPQQEKKYKEKMTAQAYAEIEKMMSNLGQVFEEIGLSDHATIPT